MPISSILLGLLRGEFKAGQTLVSNSTGIRFVVVDRNHFIFGTGEPRFTADISALSAHRLPVPEEVSQSYFQRSPGHFDSENGSAPPGS